MARMIVHRGPDDHGTWHDNAAGIAFGHQRLSIVDLSPAGHQPMICRSGRYVLVFNGEIYNHLDIRRELESQREGGWIGHSDTETLLAAINAWGVMRALQRAVGMFALGLWDRKDSTLTLARDRLGEKPLYYGRVGKTFVFASELKSIIALDDFDAAIDRRALHQMLSWGYVPEPLSIFSGLKKLIPGTLITISTTNATTAVPRPFWSAVEKWSARSVCVVPHDSDDAADRLESLLSDAVKGQMVADVPVGAFLSGGIDSSLIVALMQKHASERVRTFTVSFGEREFDESEHALAVARHLRTHHTELKVSSADAVREVPTLAGIYDEPMADSSQLPTLLVSRLARQHVTVAITGDGGDELFGGYNRHLWGARLWKRISGTPLFARRTIGALLQSRAAGACLSIARPLLPSQFQFSSLSEKLQRVAFAMGAANHEVFFDRLATRWPNAHDVVLGVTSADDGLPKTPAPATSDDWMMLRDLMTYLPGDVLVKVDRAAMAVSLETRTPYLDHRVVEFALGLPHELKIRDGVGKWLLRQVLYRHVPRSLMERPKMGFAIPLRDWLKSDLRDWADELMSPGRLSREGYFNPKTISTVWREHLAGRKDHSEKLWAVLSFQAWMQRWVKSR